MKIPLWPTVSARTGEFLFGAGSRRCPIAVDRVIIWGLLKPKLAGRYRAIERATGRLPIASFKGRREQDDHADVAPRRVSLDFRGAANISGVYVAVPGR
jgi:hypothetical protein